MKRGASGLAELMVKSLMALVGAGILSGCAVATMGGQVAGERGWSQVGTVPQAPASTRVFSRPRGETLAVADLQATGVSAGDASVITSLLRGELVKNGKFKVVEKSNMDKILAEQTFQQTGCTSSECAVKLGKILNVKLMIVGEFGKLMGDSFVNVRVIEVESGEVVFADKAKGNTSDALENSIAGMAARLSGGGSFGEASE